MTESNDRADKRPESDETTAEILAETLDLVQEATHHITPSHIQGKLEELLYAHGLELEDAPDTVEPLLDAASFVVDGLDDVVEDPAWQGFIAASQQWGAAQTLVATGRQEAEEIIADARAEAEEILAQARSKAAEIEDAALTSAQKVINAANEQAEEILHRNHPASAFSLISRHYVRRWQIVSLNNYLSAEADLEQPRLSQTPRTPWLVEVPHGYAAAADQPAPAGHEVPAARRWPMVWSGSGQRSATPLTWLFDAHNLTVGASWHSGAGIATGQLALFDHPDELQSDWSLVKGCLSRLHSRQSVNGAEARLYRRLEELTALLEAEVQACTREELDEDQEGAGFVNRYAQGNASPNSAADLSSQLA